MIFEDVIAKAARNGRDLTDAELKFLLGVSDDGELARLYRTSYQIKLANVGNTVRLRGLIEIGNICTKDCFYCGIRKSNHHVQRFTMTLAEVAEAAKLAMEFGYGSVVIQGGERSDQSFTSFITQAIRQVKQISAGKLGITLSLGEQSREVLQQWFDAGAHRYLLRIEASNRELYQKLHPDDPGHSYDTRVECLRLLRQVGYQVGTGVMIGLPMQTLDDLVDDLKFFRRMDVDMIGMGPYLPHHDTPLGRQFAAADPAQALELGLKMIAVTRIYLQNVNIASTTALQTLAPDGRERGLLAGANVIMPNIGSLNYRHNYLLYDNKPGLDENAAAARQKLEAAIRRIGETVVYNDWGDSPHFKKRLHSD